MKSLDKQVVLALLNDEELSKSIDKKVFRYVVPQSVENNYPYMRVAEINNIDYEYLNDTSHTSLITIQVDLWDKNPDRLISDVHRIMLEQGFKRQSVTTDYEEENQAVRKIFRYSTIT